MALSLSRRSSKVGIPDEVNCLLPKRGFRQLEADSSGVVLLRHGRQFQGQPPSTKRGKWQTVVRWLRPSGSNSTLEKRKWQGDMNEIIEVTISNDGTIQTLVKNTREDLLHDFQYFLQESKQHDPNVPESMFLNALLFLRAALLTLFA
jgi:hypothetical protein